MGTGDKAAGWMNRGGCQSKTCASPDGLSGVFGKQNAIGFYDDERVTWRSVFRFGPWRDYARCPHESKASSDGPGATGVAGQQFVAALAGHPWFSLARRLCASERSAGRSYKDALRDSRGSLRFYAGGEPPAESLDLPVFDSKEVSTDGSIWCFRLSKAMPPKNWSRDLPPTFRCFRRQVRSVTNPMPILLPGVNRSHAALLRTQQKRRVSRFHFARSQLHHRRTCYHAGADPCAVWCASRGDDVAASGVGAGRSPGVVGLDIIDNVIPFIAGEEEKSKRKPARSWGTAVGHLLNRMRSRTVTDRRKLHMHSRRGSRWHTEAVFRKPSAQRRLWKSKPRCSILVAIWRRSSFRRCRCSWISVTDDPYRPQPRLDRDCGGGRRRWWDACAKNGRLVRTA